MSTSDRPSILDVLERHGDVFRTIEDCGDPSVAEQYGSRPLEVLEKCRERAQE